MALKTDDKTGASAIEFAIILPVLILFLFGIIEFGILFYDKAVITNASREGARAGIVYRYPFPETQEEIDQLETEIKQVVLDYCAGHLITFATTPSLTIAADWTGYEAGDTLTVTALYDYQFLVMPNFITTLTGGINLAATTVMRME